MKNKIFLFTILILVTLFGVQAQVNIRMPAISITEGQTSDIPIVLETEVTGLGVYAYSLQFNFDPYYLEISQVVTSGTASNVLGTPAVNVQNGKLSIAAAGTSPLVGSVNDTFLIIRVKPLKPGGLYFNSTGSANNYFNEGTPELTYTGQYISIIAKPVISLNVPNTVIAVGDSMQLWVGGNYTEPFIYEVLQPALGLVSNSGMFTATNMGFTHIKVTDANGIIDTTNVQIEIRGFKLKIPSDITQVQGDTIDIPVLTSSLNNLGVISGSFTVEFNNNVLEPIEIIHQNTALHSFQTPDFLANNDKIYISFAGVEPVNSESDTLLLIRFKVSSVNTGGSGLNFLNVIFNEDLKAVTTNGYFYTTNYSNIDIAPWNGDFYTGDSVQLQASNGVEPYTWQVSNTNVASISATGMLQFLGGGLVTVTATDVQGASRTTGTFNVYDTYVYFNDTTGPLGREYNMPLYIDDFPDNQEIFSLEINVEFNDSYLEFVQIDQNNALTQGWNLATSLNGNVLRIAAANTTPITGALVEGRKPLFFVRYKLKPEFLLHYYAAVNVTKCVFNEGNPNTKIRSGILYAVKEEDLRVTEIQHFRDTCSLSTQENVTVTIQNNGYVTYQAGEKLGLSMKLNSDAEILDTLVLATNFEPTQMLDFTFAQTLNLSMPGNYYLAARTTLSADLDENPSNDNKAKSFYVFGNPDVGLGDDIAICAGQNTVIQVNGYQNYLWNVDSVGSSITVDSTGDYYVYVTDINGCSAYSDTVHVLVRDLPVVQLTLAQDTAICQGNSFSLTTSVPFNNYQWNTGAWWADLWIDTQGHYAVYATDEFGCSAWSDSVYVTVNELPIVTISANDNTEFCFGSSVELSPSEFYATYLWSNDSTTYAINVTTSGEYTLTATDFNGCTSVSNPITVVVTQSIGVNIQALGETTFCEGGSVVLRAPTSFSWYEWSNGETTTDITVDTTGDYVLTVTDFNNCMAISNTIHIEVNPNPVVNILTAGNGTICTGKTEELYTPDNFVTYMWNTGENTPSIIVDTPGDYSLTVTDVNACSGTSAMVSITKTPDFDVPVLASGATSFCEGNNVELSVDQIYASYLWNTGETTYNLSVNTSGVYNVTVVNADGCQSVSQDIMVTVNPNPIVSVEAKGAVTFCEGGSVDLSPTQEFTSYLWSNGLTSQVISVNSTGDYQLTVTDVNNCSATSNTIHVQVNANPVVNILADGPTEFCLGKSVGLYTQESYQLYLWSNNETTPGITAATPGFYSLTATDANGCSGVSNSIMVSLLPPFDVNIATSNQPVFCEGDSVKLSVADTFVSYLWSSGQTTNEIVVKEAGTYSLVVENADGCKAESEGVVVVVNQNPIVSIVADGATNFCEGGSVTLRTNDSFTNYEWNNGDLNPSIVVNATGEFYLTVTDGNGCNDTSNTIGVVVDNMPVASFSVQTNQLVATFTNLSSGAQAYEWNFGDNSTIVSITNPEHTYAAAGTYAVLLTAFNNTCNHTFSNNVTVTTTGIELNLLPDNAIYPNPATQIINISVPAIFTRAMITDLYGRVLDIQEIEDNILDVSKLPQGMYTLILINDAGRVSARFVKE